MEQEQRAPAGLPEGLRAAFREGLREQRSPGLNTDMVVGLVAGVLALLGWRYTRHLGELSGVFPRAVVVILAVLAVISLIKGFWIPQQRTLLSVPQRKKDVLGLAAGAVAYAVVMRYAGFWLSSVVFFGAACGWLRQLNEREATNTAVSTPGEAGQELVAQGLKATSQAVRPERSGARRGGGGWPGVAWSVGMRAAPWLFALGIGLIVTTAFTVAFRYGLSVPLPKGSWFD